MKNNLIINLLLLGTILSLSACGKSSDQSQAATQPVFVCRATDVFEINPPISIAFAVTISDDDEIISACRVYDQNNQVLFENWGSVNCIVPYNNGIYFGIRGLDETITFHKDGHPLDYETIPFDQCLLVD